MTLPSDLRRLPGLSRALRAYLPRQRWFAGGAPIATAVLGPTVWLRRHSPAAAITVVNVTAVDGSAARYALLLGLRPATAPLPAALAGARLSPPEAATGEWLVYDGLADPTILLDVLARLYTGETVSGAGATVRFERAPGAGPPPTALPPSARLLSGDQSNTAATYDDQYFLKWFRRLWPGPSPELELPLLLLRNGFTALPHPIGSVTLETGGEVATLAVVQTHLGTGTDGFTLALTSLRDLFGDLREDADGEVPLPLAVDHALQAQGSSFEPHAAHLGALTGSMHLALARGGDDPATTSRTGGVRDLTAWAARTEATLGALLARGDPRLASLRTHRSRMRTAIRAMGTLATAGQLIRVHGDYHLGQVVRTNDGWHVLDFEGEPNRPITERRQPASPLRDVAGMLRSFSYAAEVALRQQARATEPAWRSLEPYGRQWTIRCQTRFLNAYRRRLRGSGLLPPARGAVAKLLTTFQLEKALYEVRYEADHRPEWVEIHIAGIARLCNPEAG